MSAHNATKASTMLIGGSILESRGARSRRSVVGKSPCRGRERKPKGCCAAPESGSTLQTATYDFHDTGKPLHSRAGRLYLPQPPGHHRRARVERRKTRCSSPPTCMLVFTLLGTTNSVEDEVSGCGIVSDSFIVALKRSPSLLTLDFREGC